MSDHSLMYIVVAAGTVYDCTHVQYIQMAWSNAICYDPFTNYQFLIWVWVLDLDWSLTILCKYWADSVKILDNKCCANIGQILGKYWANIWLLLCKYWENIVQIPLNLVTLDTIYLFSKTLRGKSNYIQLVSYYAIFIVLLF